MISVVLYEPEIPPNAGNIIRLCANTGTMLHLIEPLGFDMDDKRLRRAGLDYHEAANVTRHPSLAGLLAEQPNRRVLAVTTKGTMRYSDVAYRTDDLLLFGPESRGLPPEILEEMPENQRIRIPMRPQSRSLNLANAVAVVVFEVWRQQGFTGAI